MTGDENSKLSIMCTLTLQPRLLYQIIRVERLRVSVWVFQKMNYFLRSDKQLSFVKDTKLQYGLPKSSMILTVTAFLISLWHLYGTIF